MLGCWGSGAELRRHSAGSQTKVSNKSVASCACCASSTSHIISLPVIVFGSSGPGHIFGESLFTSRSLIVVSAKDSKATRPHSPHIHAKLSSGYYRHHTHSEFESARPCDLRGCRSLLQRSYCCPARPPPFTYRGLRQHLTAKARVYRSTSIA